MEILKTLVATTMLIASSAAFAHGTEDHAKKTGPVKKEQKDWGIAGDAKAAKRTVEVSMLDTMKFSPDKIDVRVGDTLKFIVKNSGNQMHEFVIGTTKENDEHAALMLKFPNMEHDEPFMAHVAPGKTGEIVWRFNKVGNFDFACLMAGHYQAGMIGKITVAAAGSKGDGRTEHKH